MAPEVITRVDLPGLKHVSSGKVREMFDLGKELLIVTTDRISAFDVVLPDGIPWKGHVLSRLSAFWFDYFRKDVRHHLITDDVNQMPAEVKSHAAVLAGRTHLVKKARPFPIECVARGYLLGSGWKDYQANGEVCGIRLPRGLKLAERLPEPIFTPATKAQTGHDENVDFGYVVRTVGKETAVRLRELTLTLYRKAHEFALKKGIIIADTKFEFGEVDGEITLIDEALTPDSSRFWPADRYKPGENPPSYDKQYVRDYLESIQFNKKPPAPRLPEEVIRKTSEKYREAYRLLTGKEIE